MADWDLVKRLLGKAYVPPPPDWWPIESAQAARCPCRGSDDYCECQNVDWAERDALRARRDEVRRELIHQARQSIADGGRTEVHPSLLLEYFGEDA